MEHFETFYNGKKYLKISNINVISYSYWIECDTSEIVFYNSDLFRALQKLFNVSLREKKLKRILKNE